MNLLRKPIDLYVGAIKAPFNAVGSLFDRDRDPRAEAADKLREEADQRAQERKQTAEQRRKQRVSTARKTEARRKRANAAASGKVEQLIDEEARRARVAALEEKSSALDKQDKALKAAKDAKRLEKAAQEVKSAR